MGKFTVDKKVTRTIEMRDEDGQPLKESSAEAKFAEWLLGVLERGWLQNNKTVSGFGLMTRHKIVIEALNSQPKGLSAFRKDSPSYNNYGRGRVK